jgi:ribosomal-protein-alanine N-acetyltransferase
MTPRRFDPARDSLEMLAALHRTSFPDAWDAPALAALLAAPGTFVFHLADGFVMARSAGGEAEILTLAVAPPARGRGIGRALMQAAAAHAARSGADALFLEVGTDNPAALALYGTLGFVRVGMRKAYYGAGDALVLKAALPLSPREKFP